MSVFLLWFVQLGAVWCEVFKSKEAIHVGLLVHGRCANSTQLTLPQETLVNSAIWAAHRLQVPDFGVTIYTTCQPKDEYQAIFELFQNERQFLLGLISDATLSPRIRKFVHALGLQMLQTDKCKDDLVRASVTLLIALNWVENITVVAPNAHILDAFSKTTKNEWICVKNAILYKSTIPVLNASFENFVVFGDYESLTGLVQTSDVSNSILVPLDASHVHDLPENTYLISVDQNKQQNYTPNPQVFEIATPLAVYSQNLKQFLRMPCNESTDKVNCLKNKYQKVSHLVLEPTQVADLLRIDGSTINYYVYKSENASLRKIFAYNVFAHNLTQMDATFAPENTTRGCSSLNGCQRLCKNFDTNDMNACTIRIRPESWVFAFLSLSLLGVLFSLAILIFLLVSITRRKLLHLEGNPVLTILLLVVVMLMFASVVPLVLDSGQRFQEPICLARVLSVTLSFAGAFALMLSRCILLATASKELGFMSHVAGPVQSFLCLFIFGVQAALGLQVISKCGDFFVGGSFVYLLSYNAMLLLLLLCFCPMIVRSERNYREGKYFTWAIVIVCVLWTAWLPAYVFVDSTFRDAVICFGLVSTASALLATIFVPRTYLMTIAAARDKLTSTLPGAPNAVDIYRAATQPVYDCVNVAAINAVTVARAGVTPDLYSCPNLAEDEFDVRCATPIVDDKVTRF